jgi:hypothetical protein
MRSQKKVSLLILALFIATTGLCLGILLTLVNMPLEGGAIAVLGFGPVYLYLDRKHMPGLLIGLSIFIYFYHALGYAIGPLAQRYILHSEAFIEEGMVLAQWGAVLGLATYALVFPKVFRAIVCRFGNDKVASPNASPAGSKWAGYAVLLLLISVLILFYGYVSGGARRIGGLNTDASILTQTIISSFWYAQIIVFFFLGFLAVKRRGWWTVLTVFAYVAYAGFQTLEGSRGPLLTSMLMLATGVVWAGFSVRKTLLALCLSAFLLIPLAGVVDFYRSYTTASQYEEGFLERITAFSQAMQGLKAMELEGSQIANQAFIYAISAITVDRVMVMTPDVIPYAGFENLDALLYIYIPAVIASNRPEINDGNIIAAIYGMGYGTKSTYYYIPSVGEGYRRFGWVGIPLMYAISGIIFGAAIAICWAKRQKREWAALLVFLVIQAPAVWGFTLNYMFYFALFYVPKYYIYLAVLSKLQDVFASFHKIIRRPGIMHHSGDTSCQGWSL